MELGIINMSLTLGLTNPNTDQVFCMYTDKTYSGHISLTKKKTFHHSVCTSNKCLALVSLNWLYFA